MVVCMKKDGGNSGTRGNSGGRSVLMDHLRAYVQVRSERGGDADYADAYAALFEMENAPGPSGGGDVKKRSVRRGEIRKDAVGDVGRRACPTCGSSLAGLRTGICSVCGRPICERCGDFSRPMVYSSVVFNYDFRVPICRDCFVRSFEIQEEMGRAISYSRAGNLSAAFSHARKAFLMAEEWEYGKETGLLERAGGLYKRIEAMRGEREAGLFSKKSGGSGRRAVRRGGQVRGGDGSGGGRRSGDENKGAYLSKFVEKALGGGR